MAGADAVPAPAPAANCAQPDARANGAALPTGQTRVWLKPCNSEALKGPASKELFKDVFLEELGGSAERLFVGAFGVVSKQFGRCMMPPACRVAAVRQIRDSWHPKESDVLVASVGLCTSHFKILQPVMKLIEQQSGAFQRQAKPTPSIPANSLPCGRVSSMQHHELFCERGLEVLASKGGLDAIDRVESSSSRRCLISKLPPWIFYPDNDQEFPGQSSIQDVGRSSSSDESVSSGPESLQRKIVVLCSDPRYLLMEELKLLRKWPMVMCSDGSIKRDVDADTLDILEAFIRNDFAIAGGIMKKLVGWAKEAVRRPSEVRLFFMEDFVLDPSSAMRGLARFLSLPESSEATLNAIKEVEACHPMYQNVPSGPSPVTVLDQVQQLTVEFERNLCALSPGLQDLWQDQIGSLMLLSHPRLTDLAGPLLQHARWKPLQWWILHSAELCRPCTFFAKDRCRVAAMCDFCHLPGHQPKPQRPSKKERLRRDRRRNHGRTPSPQGLSS